MEIEGQFTINWRGTLCRALGTCVAKRRPSVSRKGAKHAKEAYGRISCGDAEVDFEMSVAMG